MFIFMEQDTSAFKDMVSDRTWGQHTSDTGIGYQSSDRSAIRRPYRGIQIKDDTYSILTIRKADGSTIPLVSESAYGVEGGQGKVAEYADYILQHVNDQRMEKQQIIETFGESYVFFFGERPRVVTFSGVLINTDDFTWRTQFWYNYDKYLRGTKLVQSNARAYLAYDTMIIEGFPISAQANDDSSNPYMVQFQMSMLVTNSSDYTNIGSTMFPGHGSFPDVDVKNRNLQLDRAKFISTTSAVRNRNLTAKPSAGVLSTIRSGINSMNNIMSLDFLGDYMRMANDVLGGRVVRTPIGVAGYLESVSGGGILSGGERTVTVAAGSLDSFAISAFDAKTGTLSTATGSVKLRLPAYAQFAPVGDDYRTYKWKIFIYFHCFNKN